MQLLIPFRKSNRSLARRRETIPASQDNLDHSDYWQWRDKNRIQPQKRCPELRAESPISLMAQRIMGIFYLVSELFEFLGFVTYIVICFLVLGAVIGVFLFGIPYVMYVLSHLLSGESFPSLAQFFHRLSLVPRTH